MKRQTIAALLSLIFAQGAMADTPYFLGLGDLPGGSHNSFASGVSADGSAVVGFGISENGKEAFRWTAASGMTGLGFLPDGLTSEAHDFSADGSTVVGVSYRLGIFPYPRAFRWTAATGMVELELLANHPEFLPGAGANAVSADGSVIVGTGDVAVGDDTGVQAFRWTQESGMVGLGIVLSIGTGVSADGSVIAGYGNVGGRLQAFRWTKAEGAVGLGFLSAGVDSRANAISPDGTAIVGNAISSLGGEAFRWTAEQGMIGLGDLPGGCLGAMPMAFRMTGRPL